MSRKHLPVNAPERTRRTGFTLVEMLVVLAIISLLLGIAVPFLAISMRRSEIDRAVVTVQMTALEARSKAVEMHAEYALDLHAETNAFNDHSGERIVGVFVRDVAKNEPVGAVRSLPDTVRLVLGSHPASLTFTPSGGLNTGTNMNGFLLVGVARWQGAATGGGHNTVTVSPSLTQSYANYYAVVMTGAAAVRGRAGLITSNTSSVISIASDWSSVASNFPTGGEQIAIVAPNNVRKVVVLSTTGQVVATTPEEAP